MPYKEFTFVGTSAADPAAGDALVTTDAVRRPGIYRVRLFVSSSLLPYDFEFQHRTDGGTTRLSQLFRITQSPFSDHLDRHMSAGDTIRLLNRNAVVGGEVAARVCIVP